MLIFRTQRVVENDIIWVTVNYTETGENIMKILIGLAKKGTWVTELGNTQRNVMSQKA